MRSTTYNKVVNFFKVFSGFIIAVPLLIAGAVQAATMYSSGSLLQPNDVTSSHIRQNTILNEDISQTTAFTFASTTTYKLGVGSFYATSTVLLPATTTINGVAYAWPISDGTDNSTLTTNAAGTLTWESAGVNRNIFGNGNYGPLTGASATSSNSIFTNLSANIAIGTISVSVASSTNFAANDKMLIWQTTGTQAGIWEIVEISTVSTNTITLKAATQNSFTAIGTQVLRMAEYTSVNLTSTASFTDKQWDGVNGGIVAFFATEGVVFATSTNISLNGWGFRGGAGCADSCIGWQGEGTTGTTTAQSIAANGNGAGGGPDSSNGLRTGSGGGSFENGLKDTSTSTGGKGLTYYTGKRSSLTYKAPLLWLGGGGGGGGAGAGSTGMAGGDGGGAMLIISPYIVIDGGLTARGNLGTDSGSGVAGSGGNGGAGTLIFATDSFRVASSTDMVSANTGTNSANDLQIAGGKGQYYPITPLTTITNF